MVFIPKPQNRESIIFFGDGDEATFGYIGNSSVEGYYLIHFRPTPKMRWKNQIQENDYDQFDRWIKRRYKKDLCIQLSFDPDYPVWIILCDYKGNEDTPMFNIHQNLLIKNRDLARQVQILRTTVNKIRLQQRRDIENPDESEVRFVDRIGRIKRAIGDTTVVQQQQPSNVTYPES